MGLSAVLAKRPAFYVSKNAPLRKAPREAGASTALEDAAFYTAQKKQSRQNDAVVRSGKAYVPHHLYPELVELKIAGRSDKEIAKQLDSNPMTIKLHVARAMAAYRRGEIEPDEGATVNEARAKGASKSIDFAVDITAPAPIHVEA